MTSSLSHLAVRVAEHCAAVALHEAGHAAVARFYGARAETLLSMEGGALGGRTEYPYDPFTEHQFRIVALAGSIAEVLWQRPDVTVEQLIEEKWTPTSRDAEDAGEYGAELAGGPAGWAQVMEAPDRRSPQCGCPPDCPRAVRR